MNKILLNRVALLDRAAQIADAMLPDLSVIGVDDAADEVATECLRFWEAEAVKIGETVCDACGPSVADEQFVELRDAVETALVRKIETRIADLSADAISYSRIETLRANAGAAGDLMMAAICDRALGMLDGVEREEYRTPLTDAEWATVSAMTRAEARAECARCCAESEG